MKNHSFISSLLIFSIVFCVFMLPPLMVTEINPDAFTAWKFPIIPIANALTIIIVLIFLKKTVIKDFEQKPVSRKPAIIILLCSAAYTLLTSFSLLSRLFPKGNIYFSVEFPDTSLKVLFCFLNFLSSACFEEGLYRIIAPQLLYSILSSFCSEKVSAVISELCICLLFAFAHFYAGSFGIINGIFGYIVLRLLYRKTGSFTGNTLVHFLYNVTQLFINM